MRTGSAFCRLSWRTHARTRENKVKDPLRDDATTEVLDTELRVGCARLTGSAETKSSEGFFSAALCTWLRLRRCDEFDFRIRQPFLYELSSVTEKERDRASAHPFKNSVFPCPVYLGFCLGSVNFLAPFKPHFNWTDSQQCKSWPAKSAQNLWGSK